MKLKGLGFLLVMLTLTACQPAATTEPGTATATLSPTSTSTSTSTPQPSAIPPTATGTPLPAVRVFKDDFSQDSPYWSFLQVDAGQSSARPEVKSGFLLFDLPAPNQWLYALYEPFAYTDVRLDADVQVRGGPQGTPGLVCRYDNERGWYEFDIHEDQTYVLLYGQWLADGVARYTPLVRAGSEKILPSENEMGLLCEGDTLTPYINGTQLRRQQEKTFALTSGKIGVAASAFEDGPVVIAYDWMQAALP
jgi:hypothetical protein